MEVRRLSSSFMSRENFASFAFPIVGLTVLTGVPAVLALAGLLLGVHPPDALLLLLVLLGVLPLPKAQNDLNISSMIGDSIAAGMCLV